MGVFLSCSEQDSEPKSSNPNPQSYSCQLKIDDTYNDLSYEKLKNYIQTRIKSVKKKKRNKNFSYNDYLNEFENLQNFIDYSSAHMNALDMGIPELCRYSDIKTYQHNNIEINTKTKYINASPIIFKNDKKYFISSQGPKPNTIDDFWTMIEQYNCNIIVMLCKLAEGGREKCANYWEIKKPGKYSVKIIDEKENKFDNTIIIERNIKLINNSTKNERKVIQLHYKGWPDHGVPRINETFKAFLFMIAKIDEVKKDGPGVIHCSAGVGRTGTFISIYILYKEIIAQIKDSTLETINFNVFNIVRKLKEMRILMVQTEKQYKFIYDFIDRLLEEYNQ